MNHRVSIKLENDQKQDIIHAIHNNSHLTLHIYPRQLMANAAFAPGAASQGDTLMLTKRQATQIYNAMIKNEIVTLKFTKAQLKKMSEQIGSGILDSLSSMFNSAKSYVSSGVNKFSNYLKPQTKSNNIEMKDFAGLKNTRNSKAQQFFDDNKQTPFRKTPTLSTFDKMQMERPDIKAVKAVKPSTTMPPFARPTFDYKPMNNVKIQTIKNTPLTGTERALADWKMQKLGVQKPTWGDSVVSGLDSIQNKYNDFTF